MYGVVLVLIWLDFISQMRYNQIGLLEYTSGRPLKLKRKGEPGKMNNKPPTQTPRPEHERFKAFPRNRLDAIWTNKLLKFSFCPGPDKKA